MLSLGFKGGEYAFVYHKGRPVGVIRVGDMSPRISLLFGGHKLEFEILRPSVVARRYGDQELARLIKEFAV